ncbi:MAG: hypothetical protein RXO32_11945 [Thermoproteus sp.]|jgi:hypothetical protein
MYCTAYLGIGIVNIISQKSSMRLQHYINKLIRPSADPPTGKVPGSLTGKNLPVRFPVDIPVEGRKRITSFPLTISMASAGSA